MKMVREIKREKRKRRKLVRFMKKREWIKRKLRKMVRYKKKSIIKEGRLWTDERK